MGQIVSAAAKPKRCNLQSLSSLGTPAAGEYILVSSDNSMNAAGQGNFDCYIVGDGTKAATALALKRVEEVTTKVSITGNNNTGVRSDLFLLVANRTYRILVTRPNIPMNTVTSSSGYTRFWVEDENGTIYFPKVYMGDTLLSEYDFTPSNTGLYKFGMRANKGEVQTFILEDITNLYNLDRVYVMPDEWGVMINTSGTKTAPSNTPKYKGIKYIKVSAGDIIVYGTSTHATLSVLKDWTAIAFSTDKTTWSPKLVIPYTYDDGTFGFYCVENDGWVALGGDFRSPVWYKKVSSLNFQREKDSIYFPCFTDKAYIKVSSSAIYTDLYFKTSTAKTIFIPVKQTTRDLFYGLTNASYTVSRYIGLRNHYPVKMETTPTVNDNVRGTLVKITTTFLADIDEVAVICARNNGYSSTDYDAFGLVNTYELNNVYNTSIFGYSQPYDVGDLVNYRSGKVSLVTKTKAANSYPTATGIQDVVLLDTRKLPLSTSVTTFMTYVQQKAENIGMTGSTWVNPYGGRLYGFNFTTAADLLKMMFFAVGDGRLLEYMGCESADVTIYGEHERTTTINNNINTQFKTFYSSMHSGATCPYRLIANKAGAHTNETDVHTNGFALVMLAEVEGRLVVAATGIGDTSLGYTEGRENRVKGMVELLDICAASIRGEDINGMSVTFCNIAAAAFLPPFAQTYASLNLDYIYSLNPTTEFMPASVSKVMAAIGMLDWLDMGEFHSIWQDANELVNDSDFTAYAGDVQSVKSSMYAMLTASEGANTLSLARVAGEHIIRNKYRFLPD